MMKEEFMRQLALKNGFAAAAVIHAEEIYTVPEYREFCVQNLCGNYGKNYGCPPYCGTPEEMRKKILRYSRALVLQTRNQVEDMYDGAETGRLKKAHTKKTLQLIRLLKEQGMEGKGLAIMAGSCNLCESCKMPEGQPCPHEDMSFSCLSAYCIDAGHLAKSCGMDMSWTGNIVSFFSIYLFDE